MGPVHTQANGILFGRNMRMLFVVRAMFVMVLGGRYGQELKAITAQTPPTETVFRHFGHDILLAVCKECIGVSFLKS